MNRFQILRGEDPFADKPNGDENVYKLMGQECNGWLIDESTVTVDVNETSLKFMQTIKYPLIEIYFKNGSSRTFTVLGSEKLAVIKNKKVRVKFTGRITQIQMPTYKVNKR